MLCCNAVVKLHDNQSEGLSRKLILDMVVTAGGGRLDRAQAEHVWDRTIYPYGKRLGLLTGYVKTQEGTSKRTAAGDPELQRQWYDVVTNVFDDVRKRAMEVLGDRKKVDLLMPYLVWNLDEECLLALAKNYKVAGSKGKKKHNNQNASSRSAIIFLVAAMHSPGG